MIIRYISVIALVAAFVLQSCSKKEIIEHVPIPIPVCHLDGDVSRTMFTTGHVG